jgi:AraC family transcriptional regulator
MLEMHECAEGAVWTAGKVAASLPGMAAPPTEPSDLADIAPLLAQVRDSLDGDLALEALARLCGVSPFQLHRRFTKAVGETPRRHVERVRLERAAYLLAVTDARVVGVALDVGFDSHEAFSRAFRRWSGRSPTAWRREAKAWQAARLERNRRFTGDGCRFTEVWFETRPPTAMLAIRRLGPYADLNLPAARAPWFTEIEAWAAARGAPLQPSRWGPFPDDPTLTPARLQAADLCIPVRAPVAGDGRVRCLELAGGLYGKIGHLGPGPTVGQAYRQLADAIRRSAHAFREGPPVQVFFEGEPERFEIWFPVRRR